MAKKAIRPIRIEGNIAYIPLTRGYEAIIDADDVPMVAALNWCVAIRAKVVYAVTNLPAGSGRKQQYLHRLVHSAANEAEVDHINGNGLDCRRSNLRTATKAQNQWNQSARTDNRSGVRGVCFDARRGKWRARIWVLGREVSLGRFGSREVAAAAYQKASADFYGEFGRPG